MDDFILEERIKETLQHKAGEVHVDAVRRQRIETKVYQRIEEENRMKNTNWKKTAVVAAAICILGSISAMALGRATSIVSYSSREEMVTDFSQAASMQKGYNSQVKVVENFSNGYKFAEAMPTYEEEKDEKGNTLLKQTQMSFRYVKEGRDSVSFSGGPSTAANTGSPDDQVLKLENGVELRYSTLHSKFVPVDYQATEEELALAKAGKLNLGYGNDKVEEMDSSSVSWKEGDISYTLFTFDSSMTADEMLQMAKEIVESR